MTPRRFVVANAAGEVVQIVETTGQEPPIRGTGMAVLDAGDVVALDTHHVVDGALVPYTDTERLRRAQRPTHPAAWDNVARRWVDTRTLDQLKRDKSAQINAVIESREREQSRPSREIALASATLKPVPAAAVARLQAIETAIVALRAALSAVAAAETVEAVEAVKWAEG